MAEAAAVCLDSQGHRESVRLLVRGHFDAEFPLLAPPVTDQMRRTYHDLEEATEEGAYGIAILLTRRLTGLTVVLRARRGPGFDYWLGPDDLPVDDPNFLKGTARLEVSGILQGSERKILNRVNIKLEQTKPSDGALPAYVVVVEYSHPAAQIEKK
jgi:hypothetical protein